MVSKKKARGDAPKKEGAKKDPQYRNWCFTWNDYTELPTNDDWWDKFRGITYGVCQLERGKDTGKLHLQGYLEFKNPKRFSTIKSYMEGAHIERVKGSQQQNITYCKKEDTRVDGPWEYGEPKEQGRDAALKEFDTELKKQRCIADIVRDNQRMAICYVNHNRGLEKLQEIYQAITPRTWETQFTVIVGEPGAGKTTSTAKMYPGAYWKTAGKWWDRYQGQETVVLDEFVGWYPYHELMRLGDSTPLDLERKGGTVVFLAKKVILISNKMPWDWYNYQEHKLDRESLFRRIREVIFYRKGHEPRRFTQWNDFIEFCKQNDLI